MANRRIRSYNKTEFLVLYEVTMPVFSRWIEPIKNEIGWIDKKQQTFPPIAVAKVFDLLGYPE